MNQDSVVGSAKTVAGKVQEGIGRVTDDTKAQVEGIVNTAAGTAQELYGQAKESASDAAEAVRRGASDAEDFIRHTIEKHPYATAIVATLCVGWAIGRTSRHH